MGGAEAALVVLVVAVQCVAAVEPAVELVAAVGVAVEAAPHADAEKVPPRRMTAYQSLMT